MVYRIEMPEDRGHCAICGTPRIRKSRHNGFFCPFNREGWHLNRTRIANERKRIVAIERLIEDGSE